MKIILHITVCTLSTVTIIWNKTEINRLKYSLSLSHTHTHTHSHTHTHTHSLSLSLSHTHTHTHTHTQTHSHTLSHTQRFIKLKFGTIVKMTVSLTVPWVNTHSLQSSCSKEVYKREWKFCRPAIA